MSYIFNDVYVCGSHEKLKSFFMKYIAPTGYFNFEAIYPSPLTMQESELSAWRNQHWGVIALPLDHSFETEFYDTDREHFAQEMENYIDDYLSNLSVVSLLQFSFCTKNVVPLRFYEYFTKQLKDFDVKLTIEYACENHSGYSGIITIKNGQCVHDSRNTESWSKHVLGVDVA